VTGPSGFSATANFISVQPDGERWARVATIGLPRRSTTVAGWDASDFGNYTISVIARPVFNHNRPIPSRPRLSVSSRP